MPSHTHNTPALRFPGYTGVWEQQRFHELALVRRGLTYKPSDVHTSGIRVLRSSNIVEETFTTSPDDIFVQDSAINIPFIHNGDILVTAANGSSRLVGKHAIVRNLLKNSAVPGGFMLCLSSPEPDFLNASMSSSWYSKFIHVFVAGGNGSIGNISKSSLDMQPVLVPSLPEQKQIGAFFRTLDDLLALHQRQTEKLRKLKQGLLQNMFPRDGESVPRLRFPGFTTHWKQQKFKDTFTMMQNNTLSRADLNNESGNAYDIHYGDILTIFNEYLDVTKQKLPYINANASFNTQKYSQSALQNGDVIMADTAEDTTVGKCVEITGVSDNIPVFAGLHTIPLRSSYNFGPGYLAYYLNSAAYHDQLYPFIQGIKVDSIGKSALQMTTIMFPSSYDEQKQIGSFFRTLDDLLALHEQYTVKLIHLKKGLLQKMFPQD